MGILALSYSCHWQHEVSQAVAQSPSCREIANSVVPGACLGQFQHGTLVKKLGSGADENLELASGSSGVVLTHPGIDLVAACGSPIYALADGVVAIPSRIAATRTFHTSATWLNSGTQLPPLDCLFPRRKWLKPKRSISTCKVHHQFRSGVSSQSVRRWGR